MKVKPSDISKNAAATLIALSLAVLPSAMPASAQTNSAPAQNNTESTQNNNNNSNGVVLDRTPLQESKEDNNHWGALGLLGILGLANLFRKDEPKRYRDPMGE
ncbi:WGxxGxxG family protein [Microcoleus vaginatus]|uniref:WGxxGxxG family protein n=1 Tax=Microcoleus vaginatus TaxID=119532 RepID=UPI0016886C82|nr:WGxxGxxG-CTERM domain-containing protein [Microcoleus sp. FACHB-DQ6]MBD1887499.1 WGxxGxxG-CTERM domain-containing protein [Microcoleus sp. FACHB-84]MBD2007785.1 WGxxGxxG-CTERM domain-containing protein [Microcoleus sp. FACHB-45]